jgi:AraC-like DNA-binding protein
VRLHHAKALLENGDLTVAEVAHRVGIDDSNDFSRIFRRKTGKSPRQWRQAATSPRRANGSRP